MERELGFPWLQRIRRRIAKKLELILTKSDTKESVKVNNKQSKPETVIEFQN